MFFPLSDNLILVVASYLLSQGIINSKVADKFADYVLRKYCNTSVKLVVMSFILGTVLIFVIPQPFPRVIILSSIYLNFLRNSDVIINNAVQGFGYISLTFTEWSTRMTLPSIVTTVIVMLTFIFVFKKNLTYKSKKLKTLNQKKWRLWKRKH